MTDEEFESEWDRCSVWINAALKYALGTHDIDDVKAEVMDPHNSAAFWPGEKCAVITQLSRWPKKTQLHFWLCGGDLDELVNVMRPQIEDWGRSWGATWFTTAGREGWQRVMKKYGYSPVWHVCLKDDEA